jgi:AAA+ ATPase superfamily predicted ATPase
MEIFFDRELELNKLINDIKNYNSLIVLYGNRRVGKTEIIKEIIKKIGGIYLYVDNTKSSNLMLLEFSSLIKEYFKTKLFNPPDWDSFMSGLFELSIKNKSIIYFDEFQRFEDINKSVFTAMQKNIDLYLDKSKLSIVCAGSSIGLMKRIFLDINLPLYKRATSIVNLKNFDFITSYKSLKIGIDEAIKLYSIFGGSPQFYKYFYINKLKNVEEMIKNIFSDNSTYIYEPRDFLIEEFGRRSQTYFSILYAISTGKTKLSDIAGVTDIKATSLQPYLYELKDILNLINYELPVTQNNKKINKKGIYKLNDNYMEFWFSKFYPNINQFELGNYKGVINVLIKSIDLIVSYKFEDICKEFLIYLNNINSGYLPFNIQKIGKWWGKNNLRSENNNQEEIDIVALNNDTMDIIFSECKWNNKPVDIYVFNELKRKSEIIPWNNAERKECFILFSKSGFTDNLKETAKTNNIILFDLNKMREIIDIYNK